MREADGHEELLSGKTEGILSGGTSDCRSTPRSDANATRKPDGYTKERRPLTGERRVFRLCFRFALLTRGKKVPKAW
jgi:hypothetical protein